MGGNQSIIDTPQMHEILKKDPKIFELRNRALKLLINISIQSDNSFVLQDTSRSDKLIIIQPPKYISDIQQIIDDITLILNTKENTYSGYITYQ